MCDIKNTDKRINWIEESIMKEDVTTENIQLSNDQKINEVSLSINKIKSQGALSQLIQNFDKINIKEIEPIALSNEREKLLFEKGFDKIVDEINELIFNLLNKGIGWQLLEDNIIDYFNVYNIELQEIYNWLLNNQNNSNSIFLLGFINIRGIGTNIDLKKAFNLFIDASGKNHILAQYFVGNCYEYGNGTTTNKKLAFEYLEKSANNNLSHGQLEIGYLYKIGSGVKQDFNKAFYWYEKAANNGNIIAMHHLGNCYKNGEGVIEDYNKAFELYKLSAEGGYSYGMSMLGYCYNHGVGTKVDKYKAFELYQKSAN
ncbi:hypothetical protein RclHR1_00340014 [Rhizophagus clarus]|nr:hypothetical protein RclHR1_00340014 [Rhizophagus clarus]